MQNQAQFQIQTKNDPQEDKKIINEKTVRFFADSIYQTLKDEGCEYKDILGVSSQLISLVTTSINGNK